MSFAFPPALTHGICLGLFWDICLVFFLRKFVWDYFGASVLDYCGAFVWDYFGAFAWEYLVVFVMVPFWDSFTHGINESGIVVYVYS